MMSEIDFLRAVIAADKTMSYEYGEARANGELPPSGKKWLTPKELAQLRLDEYTHAMLFGTDSSENEK